jgi:tRNA(Leu) C34 or U34 (ribose-2'-O)-methylase TrmL
MNLTTERIRALNDELRRDLPNSHAIITTGVAALGAEVVARIIKTVAVCSERSGVSPAAMEAADAAVAIPMLGMANSLNVATAAAILLHWLSVQIENRVQS